MLLLSELDRVATPRVETLREFILLAEELGRIAKVGLGLCKASKVFVGFKAFQRNFLLENLMRLLAHYISQFLALIGLQGLCSILDFTCRRWKLLFFDANKLHRRFLNRWRAFTRVVTARECL